MKLRYILLIINIFITTIALGQKFTISGYVQDSASGVIRARIWAWQPTNTDFSALRFRRTA